MEFAAGAFALSRRNLPFVEFAGEFCGLATVTELHDAAILHLFGLGANYQRPMDLPDTTGLCWREGICRCLGSYRSRVETSPRVFPLAPPSSSSSPLVPSSSSSSPLVPSSSSSSLLVLPSSSSLVPPSSSSSPLVPSSTALPEHPLVPLGFGAQPQSLLLTSALQCLLLASALQCLLLASALRCLLLASALRCLLLASALQCRLLASALKFLRWSCPAHLRLHWFRPALQSTHESQSRPSAHESQSRPSAHESWSRPAHLCLLASALRCLLVASADPSQVLSSSSAGPAQLIFVSTGSVQLSRAPTRVRAAWAPTRVRAARAPTRVVPSSSPLPPLVLSSSPLPPLVPSSSPSSPLALSSSPSSPLALSSSSLPERPWDYWEGGVMSDFASPLPCVSLPLCYVPIFGPSCFLSSLVY